MREEEKSGYIPVCLVTISAYVDRAVGDIIRGAVEGIMRVGCATFTVVIAVVRAGGGGRVGKRSFSWLRAGRCCC